MTVARLFKNDQEFAVASFPDAVALPGGLVIAPGNYTFSGSTYQCNAEGLVRLWNPLGQTQHRIIWQSDVEALLSGFAWLCSLGRSDEALTVGALITKARESRLHLRCGKTVEMVKGCLDSLSVTSRTCRVLTAETPNGHTDGHVQIEVMVDGQWRLFDPTYKRKYPGALKDAVPLTAAVVDSPMADYSHAAEPYEAGQFDVSEWSELTMRTATQRRAEAERLMQIPGIVHTDGLSYFYMPAGTEGRQSWVLGLDANYRVVSEATWLTMFYS